MRYFVVFFLAKVRIFFWNNFSQDLHCIVDPPKSAQERDEAS